MKKAYETPSVEVVKFQYRDQVVAASYVTTTCRNEHSHSVDPCYDNQITVNR